MKKISVKQLSTAFGGGSNRQCLVDGFLTGGLIVLGGLAAGAWGAVGGFLGGLSDGNSNGCFG